MLDNLSHQLFCSCAWCSEAWCSAAAAAGPHGPAETESRQGKTSASARPPPRRAKTQGALVWMMASWYVLRAVFYNSKLWYDKMIVFMPTIIISALRIWCNVLNSFFNKKIVNEQQLNEFKNRCTDIFYYTTILKDRIYSPYYLLGDLLLNFFGRPQKWKSNRRYTVKY